MDYDPLQEISIEQWLLYNYRSALSERVKRVDRAFLALRANLERKAEVLRESVIRVVTPTGWERLQMRVHIDAEIMKESLNIRHEEPEIRFPCPYNRLKGHWKVTFDPSRTHTVNGQSTELWDTILLYVPNADGRRAASKQIPLHGETSPPPEERFFLYMADHYRNQNIPGILGDFKMPKQLDI